MSAVGFNALRNAAYQRARSLGLPTSRDEDWRYVGLRGLQEDLAQAPDEKPHVVVPVGRSSEPGIVFANGVVDPQATPDLPPGVACQVYAGDAVTGPLFNDWRQQLDHYQDVTACWSLADMRSAVHLFVDRPVERPLVLLDIAIGGACGWRTRIDVDAGASLDLLIIRLVDRDARATSGLELHLGEGARATVAEVDQGSSQNGDSPAGEIFAHRWLRLARGARAGWTISSRGGRLVRHTTRALLLGQEARVDLAAAGIVGGEDQLHHHVRVEHAVGPSTSRQCFRQVVDDRARVSFDGLVTVRQGADGTDAEQDCKSLQLSDDARIGNRPQLDVFADEVSAAHGAAIGQLDEAQLAYLRSRGIDGATAAGLLRSAFLEQALAAVEGGDARGLARKRLDLGSA